MGRWRNYVLLSTCAIVGAYIVVRILDRPKRTIESVVLANAVQHYQHDFGVIDNQKKVTAEFYVSNPLPRSLRIASKETSCSCVSFESVPSNIPPLGKAHVIVDFDPIGKSGPFVNHLTLETQDPELRTLTFTLRGVVEGIWSRTSMIDLATGSVGDDIVRETQVYLAESSNARFVSVSCNHPDCSVELVNPPANVAKALGPHVASAAVRLRWKPTTDLANSLDARIEVLTDSERHPSIHISVIGRTTGPLIVSPIRLVFGRMDPLKQIERSFTIRLAKPAPFGLEDVKVRCEHKRINVSVGELANSMRTATCIVTYVPGDTGPLTATILFEQQGKTVAELPVTGVWAK